jgi:hypothetical protein
MKKRVTPQEKKRLAYERDHYVSGGESRHAFRKNWPKKKAMLNQKHRHRAAQALHKLEKLGDLESIEASGIEVTANQLRKVDPRETLQKWGVMSLQEFVRHNKEARDSRAHRATRERERIEARYKHLISALEQDPESPKAKEFLREIDLGDWYLQRFLKWNPEWKPRLKEKLLDVKRGAEKARMKREKKEAEKQRTMALRNAIQRQAKVSRP